MKMQEFSFLDGEGIEIYYCKWSEEDGKGAKGVIQLSHGMAETSRRYEDFAEVLVGEGYIVYANDHRGHGKTAKTLENVGYLGDRDGFYWLVEDMHELSNIIKKENKELPLFIFGHSMGSFLTQRYIQLYGNEIKGAILSGTNGNQGMILDLAIYIAKREIAKNGRKAKSDKLNKMSFGSYNNSFKGARTEFDWLSSDEAQVDKYISDPFCGTVFSAGFFYDFSTGLKEIEKDSNIANVPKKLPLYIFSGSKDPVGKNTKGVLKLIKTYNKFNLENVTYKFYDEGRHEMLNEINKEEVMEDVVNWLNKQI